MNQFVECVLDGDYWNIVGDSRGRHSRAKQSVFTYDANHIPTPKNTYPSKPLTPEQKEKAKQRADEQRKVHLKKVKKEHRRNVKKQKKMVEGIPIFEYLLVGSSKVAKNRELLKEHNICAVLNMTESIQNHFESELIYKRVAVEDSEHVNLAKHFDECVEFIQSHIKEGCKVLIHCQLGQSRSPTIAIAFAMKALNMTLKEAYEQYVARAGLDHVKINDGFAKQLMDWDLAIHNEQSLNLLLRPSQEGKSDYDESSMSISEPGFELEGSVFEMDDEPVEKKEKKPKKSPEKQLKEKEQKKERKPKKSSPRTSTSEAHEFVVDKKKKKKSASHEGTEKEKTKRGHKKKNSLAGEQFSTSSVSAPPTPTKKSTQSGGKRSKSSAEEMSDGFDVVFNLGSLEVGNSSIDREESGESPTKKIKSDAKTDKNKDKLRHVSEASGVSLNDVKTMAGAVNNVMNSSVLSPLASQKKLTISDLMKIVAKQEQDIQALREQNALLVSQMESQQDRMMRLEGQQQKQIELQQQQIDLFKPPNLLPDYVEEEYKVKYQESLDTIKTLEYKLSLFEQQFENSSFLKGRQSPSSSFLMGSDKKEEPSNHAFDEASDFRLKSPIRLNDANNNNNNNSNNWSNTSNNNNSNANFSPSNDDEFDDRSHPASNFLNFWNAAHSNSTRQPGSPSKKNQIKGVHHSPSKKHL